MFYRIPEISYIYVSKLDEALEVLHRLDNAKVLAGGTVLVRDLKIGRIRLKTVVDITRVNELKFIKDEGGHLRIGALTALQDIVESSVVRAKAPVLAKAVNEIASWQIRNVATIGGNLCNASPAADSAPPLMVLEARLILASKEGEREVPITQFFKGPGKTVMRPDELLKEIIVPYEKGSGQYYIKFGRRNAFDHSIVSVAALVKVSDGKFSDVRIALNSVAPTPVRAYDAENALKGREVSLDNVENASKLVLNSISPVTDVMASAEYRKEMSVVLTRDALLGALKDLGINLGGE
jgi:CO/xanthine dehydrogenase FAD-binding subunit